MNVGLRRVFGAVTVCILLGGLTACGEGASAEAPEASVAAEEAETASDEQRDTEQDAEEDQEPVPASSEGPAENWPEPEFPVEASEKTEEGVEAALQYWFETRQYARNTGDVGPLEEASYSECAFCQRQVELVQETYEDGWLVQELDEVTDLFVRIEEQDVSTAIFLLNAGAYELYWEGELYEEDEGEEETGWSVALTYKDGSWLVADLRHFASPEDIQEELEEEL